MFKKIITISALAATIGSISAQTDTTKQQSLHEAVISSLRANAKMPVTQYNFSNKQIKQLYTGADLPTVLQNAPSIHAYSDNGTGIGYSYFRLRGIDQTRINVTVNGVPINDPQNQGTFFNNFADLTSSAHSIQVQRGVGTTTNGVAAFGGSVNILTKPLQEDAEAELNIGYGSFNSRRLTAEAHTGKIGDNWGAYIRLANLATDGFRNNSGSEITSYMLSVGRTTEKNLLKFNIWGGDASSQLAYLGSDQQSINVNRRHNPITLGETDRFRQNFFQVQYQHLFNKRSGINASTYFVRGIAPQFQFYFPVNWFMPYSYFNMPEPIVGSDTIRTTDAMTSYRLNQRFWGGFVNYFYQNSRFRIDAGLHVNAFTSEHFLETQWMGIKPAHINLPHRAYFNTGYKNEASAFTKFNYNFTEKLSAFADMQLRTATFSYKPQKMEYADNDFNVENMQWLFFNPKLGLNYVLNQNISLYTMMGMAGREPTRFDYFFDDYATRDIKQNEVKPEYVRDFEAGIRFENNFLNLQLNAFYMNFKDAIINTGATNNFGAAINTNIANSFRSGIEIDGRLNLSNKLSVTHASVFSYNRIQSLTQFYTLYTDTDSYSIPFEFKNTIPALTPSVIINQGVAYRFTSWFFAEINMRYVSQQFIDNSSLAIAKINSFYVFDTKAGFNFKKWLKREVNLTCNANNIINAAYSTWGNIATGSNTVNVDINGNYVPQTLPLFFVAPPRNYFLTLNARF